MLKKHFCEKYLLPINQLLIQIFYIILLNHMILFFYFIFIYFFIYFNSRLFFEIKHC